MIWDPMGHMLSAGILFKVNHSGIYVHTARSVLCAPATEIFNLALPAQEGEITCLKPKRLKTKQNNRVSVNVKNI